MEPDQNNTKAPERAPLTAPEERGAKRPDPADSRGPSSSKFILWIILAVVGTLVLAGILYFFVVTTLLNDARNDAQYAAFRSSVAGAVSQLIISCEMGDVSPPADTSLVDWAENVSEQDCGMSGEGTFRIEARGVEPVDCTAVVTEEGATFSDPSGGACDGA